MNLFVDMVRYKVAGYLLKDYLGAILGVPMELIRYQIYHSLPLIVANGNPNHGYPPYRYIYRISYKFIFSNFGVEWRLRSETPKQSPCFSRVFSERKIGR